MPEKWTGEIIGRMHNAGVTYDDIAAELGVTKAYLSMIFNGKRSPANARQRISDAFAVVMEKRRNQQ